MADVTIQREKAARIIAQVLRDNFRLTPDAANLAATVICSRLSMPSPSANGGRLNRSIGRYGSRNDQYLKGAAGIGVPAAKAEALWDIIYELAKPLPDRV